MSNDFTEEKKSGEIVFNGNLLEVHKDRVKLPNNKESTREYINHPGAAVIIPYLGSNEILLINQYRYPIEQVTLELPAGKIDPGEDPEESVNRELSEETGFGAENIVKLSSIHSCVGYSNERIHLYWGSSLYPNQLESDEGEIIDNVKTNLDDALEMVYSEEITDAKTVIGIFWANKIINSKEIRERFNIPLEDS